jgi:hypothetical protein
MKKCLLYIQMFICVFILSCDNYEETMALGPEEQIGHGTGFFRFNYQATDRMIPMDIYYHVPDGDFGSMPILFVLHGAGRNAVEYRNAWVGEANSHKFIVITPKFSSDAFPGGDAYNLGNVFVDGDNPSATTLNPEQDWAFSVIEPLFDEIKSQLGNSSDTYNMFGFSAGAQFAHRFLMFKPNARVNKMVASAAGWYTIPDESINFPYGIKNSPIGNIEPSSYFSKNMTLQIGTLDNNPNANALRRNPVVDQQGTNRYDRAFYMFNVSNTIAENQGVTFNWQIVETPGNGHDNRNAVEQAVQIMGL